MTKLATFRRRDGAERVGIVEPGCEQLFDLAGAAERAGDLDHPFASMLTLIDAGPRGLEQARRLAERRAGDSDLRLPLSAVQLLAPVPQPRQMRDTMSFPLHIRQSTRGMRRLASKDDPEALARINAEPLPPPPAIYRQMPIFYLTNHLVVEGPDTTVRWPRYSSVMDYELEFGIFVGRTGANLTTAQAKNHIFGFTIFNDFSARDQQLKESAGHFGPTKGKSFDGSNVLGPWIVTPDEIGDPYALRMEARINGEVWSRGTSEGMIFSFEELLAYMSRDETLFAGTFIGSGTVGNGCGLEHGRYLRDGDTVELEVERIGVLRNRVERQD